MPAPITTSITWHPRTVRPEHQVIALVVRDCGPDGDPDDFRFSLRSDLFQYRGGGRSGAWFSLLTGERIAPNQPFLWTPYEDVLNSLEIAIDLQESQT